MTHYQRELVRRERLRQRLAAVDLFLIWLRAHTEPSEVERLTKLVGQWHAETR
jgi:hypothetical protein